MSQSTSAPSEMAFCSLLARRGSLSATARELDVTTPAIGKRLAQMEARLGVLLLNRTTWRISLTSEGEIYLGPLSAHPGRDRRHEAAGFQRPGASGAGELSDPAG